LVYQCFSNAPCYDDGGAEHFWSDYYPNGIAVRFTPPASRWRVTGILVYGFTVDKDEKFFMVEVRDKDLNVIHRASLSISEYFKNAALHWARIPLPGVVVKGDFYVCVYPMLDFSGTQLWVAMDNDTAPYNCFLIDCYRQEAKDWKDGQAMIRVEGEEAFDFVEMTLNSISIDEDALELSFKIVIPGNDVEVRAILQVGSLTEDCEVIRRDGLYKVRIEWSKLSGLREPAKLLPSAKALNSTATLAIELNESLLSKYLELKEENGRLRAMVNSSSMKLRALRDKLEREENATTLLGISLKEYQGMISEKTRENEKLTEELNIMRLLAISLAILTVSLLIVLLRWRIRPSRFTGVIKCLEGH
jgi:hypothetical protein